MSDPDKSFERAFTTHSDVTVGRSPASGSDIDADSNKCVVDVAKEMALHALAWGIVGGGGFLLASTVTQ